MTASIAPDKRRSLPLNRSDVPDAMRIAHIQGLLLGWFETGARKFPWRRPAASKYERVVSEVLLQRTRAEAVAAFYKRFMVRFPSWTKLACATEADLQEFLRPLGLWRRRAASLRLLAREMANRLGRFPKDRVDIEELPGVGQYITNAILMFDQGISQPLLDVNLARVLERLFGPRKLSDIRYDPYLQEIAWRVVQHRDPASLNWAFLDLAASICVIRDPKCPACPLKTFCRYAQMNGRTEMRMPTLLSTSKEPRSTNHAKVTKKLRNIVL
jgi:A/G-specific adenine glycosylase